MIIGEERSVRVSSQRWRQLHLIIGSQPRRLPRPRRRFEYFDAVIAVLFRWAVWHDRLLS